MQTRVLKYVVRTLALVSVASVSLALAAQTTSAPKAKSSASKQSASSQTASRWDIFTGYSFLSPHGSVPVVGTGTFHYQNIDWGGIMSITRYFNEHVGLQFEGDEHMESQDWPITNASYGKSTSSPNDLSGVGGGLVFRFPKGNITPFIHALGGAERVGSIYTKETWGPLMTLGGGLDIETPLFNHHLAIRAAQADYQYTYANFGVVDSSINSVRLSAGVVWHMGAIAPPPPVTLSLSASPTSVYPGEPVTVTATAGNLNPSPKQNTIYSWSGNGVTGSGTTAKVDTSSLAPGNYTVNATVKQGKRGKEGVKPWESAESTTTFTVKQFEPPTISCSASPSTIKPGESSTITSEGVSPQNRPLTYSYSAAAGTISGTGTTATFSSTGAPTGPTEITCKVTDDKGQTATGNTTVTITAPYVPPTPHAQALCSVGFSTDKRRPTRVDNEAKACLDQVALALQNQPDAKAVVVGESTSQEKATTAKEEARAAKYPRRHIKVEQFAGQRAVNAKDYLVTEKGIDASRVSAATGTADSQTAENYLVPAGADFSADVTGTTPVDESTIKPEVRKPLPMRHRARRSSR